GAGARLQSCELTFACKLPCGASDGGGDGSAAKSDAGQLCEPGREVVCPCEGGTGTKVCTDGGYAFSECSCTPPPGPAISACDCKIGAARAPHRSAFGLALAALATGLFGRRIRRHRRGLDGWS